jgi:hypothetical protein
MTAVIKATKPTKDISSAEPRDFVLNSELNTVVIYKEDEVSCTISANSDYKSTVNFDITFSQPPIVMVFVELTAGSGRWYNSPFSMVETSDPEDTYLILGDVTNRTEVLTDKFNISFHNKTASSKTIKYRYYIFMNL